MPNPYRLTNNKYEIDTHGKDIMDPVKLQSVRVNGSKTRTSAHSTRSATPDPTVLEDVKKYSKKEIHGMLRPRTSEATFKRTSLDLGRKDSQTHLFNILTEDDPRYFQSTEVKSIGDQYRTIETTQPWSLTETPESLDIENEEKQEPDEEEEVREAREEIADLKVYEDTPRWRRKKLPFNAADDDSDEYDTDLEEDFPPSKDLPVDATGKYIYEDRCKKMGVVPASFLMRSLEEGTLRMKHHYLGGPGTKPLATALKHNTVCEEINLTDNYIEGQGASALAQMLKDNMFVVNMNVSNNFIKSEGAEAFSAMLEANTTLKTLSLRGNHLTDQDAKRIAEAMKNNMSLNVLDLSHNEFGDIGGTHIAAGLAANIGLADLDLSWNHLREKGAIAIAKALAKNATLEILDLSWNGFSTNEATALAASLKTNTTLKVLDISKNRINTVAAKKLAQSIAKNSSLETFLIGMNPIGEAGLDALLKAITNNSSLKLVGVEDISTSPSIRQKIQELEASRDIMIMWTSGSPQQSQTNATVLKAFDKFLSDNADRLEDLFNQMDKDKSGDVTLEELKYGLKDFGLRLTSKQLDMLLEELDADKSGTIEYEELMSRTNIAKPKSANPAELKSDIESDEND